VAYQPEISVGTKKKITMEGDPMNIEPIIFEWNENHSRETNFHTWLRRTNREHRNYQEKQYTTTEGLTVFNKIYPTKK
jgi:hypothetical protein|tara:strand:+ start:108 stop:341 length:234 start_codon:yes stop_codon:yes gene_type:complete